ncbi:uncharacterized protein ACHE_20823A [Aspergillus chevalieri]|uniref:Uncharacterized protein n=1 Tax=Aspergillus chevalieri TaxID=182096 RepID=A0A7R7VIJ5_ASPCH|nr:uncharacterized protein ACHE_20823A [Aspergillus chevalieri]BCR85365.1 hypothetical protein ACHE_20823A [Aspergillus chevalieri]
MTIPNDHKQICSSYGAPTSGNANGNTGDSVTVPQLTPGNDGASYPSEDENSGVADTANPPAANPPAPSSQVSSAPAVAPQPTTVGTIVTKSDYITPDPTFEPTPESSSPVPDTPAPNSPAAPEPAPPATTNYIMPDLTQSTPESTEPSTPEPTHESPPTHTGPRPRPTHEWPGAAPFWQPKPHDHEGDWHSEGGPAPPKPENTLIAPAVQDDDFSLLDFLRKAEE